MTTRNIIRRRKTLVAGQITLYQPERSTNLILLINHSAETIQASHSSDPVNYYEALLGAKPSITPFVLDTAGASFYLYCANTATITLAEIAAADIGLVVNMASVMIDASTTVPADITDDAARELGLVGLKAGTNNIGDVDVLTLPALPAGTNNIGDVDVLTLPPLPAGTNNIGDVDVLTLPALPAGTNNIGDVDVLTLPPLPAGTNNIGDVDVLTLPALPSGTNNIGDVDVLTMPVVETKPATGIAPVVTNAPGAGEVTINAGAGRIFSFVSDVAGSLRNVSGTDLYLVQANVTVNLTRPLEFAANIIFNAAGAGNIYTQHE